jgi:inosine-uridine nucleoside N-ribohydrolase
MKVVIDCDPGNGVPGANVDDAIALAFALRHPEIEVESIWTVFGNTSAAEGRDAAAQLLRELGARGPRLLQGADTPLSGERAAWRSRLDAPGRSPEVCRRWGVAEPPHRYGAEAGEDPLPALAADLLAAGDGVTLVCLGPLTNLARLLRDAPAALAGIERVCLMGGFLARNEDVDTNFAVDPHAARAVLRSGLPLTVVPLDVTRTTELSWERWTRISAQARARSPEDLASIGRWLEPWLAHSSATRPVNGMWLHDLVVLAALVEPGLVARARRRVRIAERPAGKLLPDPEGTEVDMVTAVDNDRLVEAWAEAVLGVRPGA